VLVVLLHRSAVFGTPFLSTAHCFAGCTLWVAVYFSGLCLPTRDPRISETTLGDRGRLTPFDALHFVESDGETIVSSDEAPRRSRRGWICDRSRKT